MTVTFATNLLDSVWKLYTFQAIKLMVFAIGFTSMSMVVEIWRISFVNITANVKFVPMLNATSVD